MRRMIRAKLELQFMFGLLTYRLRVERINAEIGSGIEKAWDLNSVNQLFRTHSQEDLYEFDEKA
jgi:hypothetical protein